MMETISISTRCGVKLAQSTFENGAVMFWTLTSCCGAGAKYMDTGVAGADEVFTCKGCYRPADTQHGMAADSLEGLSGLLSAFGCPVPESCADHSVWSLDRLAELKTRAS